MKDGSNKEILHELQVWGCDIKGALGRMMGDEDLYISLIKNYKDTFQLDKLKLLVEENKVKEAFEIAHELKGVLGNLGLTPLYKPICQTVERLRTGSCQELSVLTDIIISEKANLDKIFR